MEIVYLLDLQQHHSLFGKIFWHNLKAEEQVTRRL